MTKRCCGEAGPNHKACTWLSGSSAEGWLQAQVENMTSSAGRHAVLYLSDVIDESCTNLFAGCALGHLAGGAVAAVDGAMHGLQLQQLDPLQGLLQP